MSWTYPLLPRQSSADGGFKDAAVLEPALPVAGGGQDICAAVNIDPWLWRTLIQRGAGGNVLQTAVAGPVSQTALCVYSLTAPADGKLLLSRVTTKKKPKPNHPEQRIGKKTVSDPQVVVRVGGDAAVAQGAAGQCEPEEPCVPRVTGGGGGWTGRGGSVQTGPTGWVPQTHLCYHKAFSGWGFLRLPDSPLGLLPLLSNLASAAMGHSLDFSLRYAILSSALTKASDVFTTYLINKRGGFCSIFSMLKVAQRTALCLRMLFMTNGMTKVA